MVVRLCAFVITMVAVPFRLMCLGAGYVYVWLDNLAASLWRK